VVILSQHEQINDFKGGLMACAIEWLATWCKQDPAPLLEGLPQDARQKLEPYRALWDKDWTDPDPGDPLLSIFSRVVKPDGKGDVPERYWQAEALSLKQVAAPVEEEKGRQADRKGLWDGFAKDVRKLPAEDADTRFESFTHLLHKHAWAVPCSYGEPGVSLYEEFRALSALVHASRRGARPANRFLLVGGDVPGIQKTIYTITSKGAAKGLRGRSFFIQLLGDAVIRCLLDRLDLPETNVVYAAGGNFMLLAPEGVEEKVGEIAGKINQALIIYRRSRASPCDPRERAGTEEEAGPPRPAAQFSPQNRPKTRTTQAPVSPTPTSGQARGFTPPYRNCCLRPPAKAPLSAAFAV
jgi:hypothetical protein